MSFCHFFSSVYIFIREYFYSISQRFKYFYSFGFLLLPYHLIKNFCFYLLLFKIKEFLKPQIFIFYHSFNLYNYFSFIISKTLLFTLYSFPQYSQTAKLFLLKCKVVPHLQTHPICFAGTPTTKA